MIVRAATVADADGIASVHVRSWQAAYRGLLANALLDGLSIEQRAAQWRTILAEDAGAARATVVAVLDGTVLGFVDAAPSRNDDAPATTGELIAIYVLPAALGTGVGRALDGNARAIRFYERAGWAADGSTKQDVLRGHPVTELRYRRPVAGWARDSAA